MRSTRTAAAPGGAATKAAPKEQAVTMATLQFPKPWPPLAFHQFIEKSARERVRPVKCAGIRQRLLAGYYDGGLLLYAAASSRATTTRRADSRGSPSRARQR